MSAPFPPGFHYSPQSPFMMWVQKVLPLAFDDALSYYESVAKMRDKLNETIQRMNETGEAVQSLSQAYTDLTDYVNKYFDEMDLQPLINEAVSNSLTNGQLQPVVAASLSQFYNPKFVDNLSDMTDRNLAFVLQTPNADGSVLSQIYTYDSNSDEAVLDSGNGPLDTSDSLDPLNFTPHYSYSGYDFGGIVSSVSDMSGPLLMFVLSSDNRFYQYNPPQQSFAQTDFSFGGIVTSVSQMAPVNYIYVLTSNYHVYAWNGSQFTDTGVVYGTVPADENFQAIINKWLDNHPEATTTVQDGSITEIKLADGSVTNDKLSQSLYTSLQNLSPTFSFQHMLDNCYTHYYKYQDSSVADNVKYGAYQGFTETPDGCFLAMLIPIEAKLNYILNHVTDLAVIVKYDKNFNVLATSQPLTLYHGGTMCVLNNTVYVPAVTSSFNPVNIMTMLDYDTLTVSGTFTCPSAPNTTRRYVKWVFTDGQFIYAGRNSFIEKYTPSGSFVSTQTITSLDAHALRINPYGGYIATFNSPNRIVTYDNDFNQLNVFTPDTPLPGELKDIAFLDGNMYVAYNDRAYIRNPEITATNPNPTTGYEYTECYPSVFKTSLYSSVTPYSTYGGYGAGTPAYINSNTNSTSKTITGLSGAPFRSIMQAIRNGKSTLLLQSDGSALFGANHHLTFQTSGGYRTVDIPAIRGVSITGENLTLMCSLIDTPTWYYPLIVLNQGKRAVNIICNGGIVYTPDKPNNLGITSSNGYLPIPVPGIQYFYSSDPSLSVPSNFPLNARYLSTITAKITVTTSTNSSHTFRFNVSSNSLQNISQYTKSYTSNHNVSLEIFLNATIDNSSNTLTLTAEYPVFADLRIDTQPTISSINIDDWAVSLAFQSITD